MDPRLFAANWADEERKAANDAEAAQARGHAAEDEVAAAIRAGGDNTRHSLLRGLVRRLTGRR
jgi:hypothetical protein